jgi:hypothetical protein
MPGNKQGHELTILKEWVESYPLAATVPPQETGQASCSTAVSDKGASSRSLGSLGIDSLA